MRVPITSARTLAHILRDNRKNKGYSQKKISEELGMIQATVSSFETSPEGTKLETLFKILAALNLMLYVTDRDSNFLEEKTNKTWDQEW